jgi:hypothetical protein
MRRRKRKRITKELIRGYFGEDAEISWVCPWRVKTITGGEVVISQREIKVIFGTEDAYRAVTLLMGECWGAGVAGRGSNEFMLASVMHGEAAGVPIRADYRNKNAGWLQVAMFFLILFVGGVMGAAHNSSALFFTVLAALVIVAAMSESSKREARKKHEQMGFPYPRVYGSAGAARREDAKRRGWL